LNGKTSKAILRFAAEYNDDLIVMGTHSHNGFEKIIVDVAAKVIKHTEIPVLIIPTDKKDLARVGEKHEVLQYI
jgi:nucleotide-binding universal stress UspA family protein